MSLFKHVSYIKIVVLCLILPLLIIGGRTYYIYNTFMTSPSYQDSINYLICHKRTFIALYKIKPVQEKISTLIFGNPPKKTTAEKLADWVEARIMYAIMHHEKIDSVKDLPCLDRTVIKALDGSSYINQLYQKALYYVTRTQPAPTSTKKPKPAVKK